MREIDLHVHTTASDGTCTPAEVAALAQKIGLKAIAAPCKNSLRDWSYPGNSLITILRKRILFPSAER